MKLRNKDDGRIREFGIDETKSFPYYLRDELGNTYWAKTIKEIADKWEEIEELKDFWYIDDFMIMCGTEGEFTTPDLATFTKRDIEKLKQIGNHFDTREEAEKAVEKLKAWKRLKDGGITFKNWTINQTGTIDCFATWGDNIPPSRKNPTLLDDLDLLFGGKE